MAEAVVVIPTYNEADNIKSVLEQVLGAGEEFSVFVVDDNSPDGTGKTVSDFANHTNRVFFLTRPFKLGLGSAYRNAFQIVLSKNLAQFLFEMDADFSHSPEVLPSMLRHARETQSDLVIGSRYVPGGEVEGWGFGRRILSRSANFLCTLLLGHRIHDYTSGYRCYSAQGLRKIDFSRVGSDGYAFQIEMAFKAIGRRLKVTEFPITFVERARGKSKMSLQIVVEAMILLIIIFIGRIVK